MYIYISVSKQGFFQIYIFTIRVCLIFQILTL